MSPGRRRAAFDPDRLDDLDDVLAPPQAVERAPDDSSDGDDSTVGEGGTQPEQPQNRAGPVQRTTRGPQPSPSTASTTSSKPRANPQQKPPPATGRQRKSPRGRIATGIRLPVDLYHGVNEQLLSGPERPAYGQLVMWTVEDEHDAVVAEVEANLPDPAARVPRGRRLAQDRVPVGLYLLGSERDELDAIAAAVAEHHGARVTRTDVAVAALRIALRARSRSGSG